MAGKVYFISGANRGIGFEFAKELSANPENTVIASARVPSKATELQKLVDSQKNLKIVALDVADNHSIDNLDAQLKEIAKNGIDVLISNAGVGESFKPAIETNEDVYLKHYKTNTLGPIFLTRALYPYLKLKDTRHLVYISSFTGSMTDHVPISSSAYGQSKAALNYFMKELSFELAAENFTVVSLDPGVVDTDMSKLGYDYYLENDPSKLEALKDAQIATPAEAAKALLENNIYKLNKEMSGRFIGVDGKDLRF